MLGLLVLMVLVIAAGLWFEPGYVLVMLGGHSIETSLMALAVALLLLALLRRGVIRLMRWLRAMRQQ